MAKFREATPPVSKVLAANTLHFKPIFDSPLKKVVRKPPFPIENALVRFGHCLAFVKNLGAQDPLETKIWFFE